MTSFFIYITLTQLVLFDANVGLNWFSGYRTHIFEPTLKFKVLLLKTLSALLEILKFRFEAWFATTIILIALTSAFKHRLIFNESRAAILDIKLFVCRCFRTPVKRYGWVAAFERLAERSVHRPESL